MDGFHTQRGREVIVERHEVRLGCRGGVVFVNGVSAKDHLLQAQEQGQVTLRAGGTWELLHDFLLARSLPYITIQDLGGDSPTYAAQLGRHWYVRAQPDGEFFMGGPGVMQHNVLHYSSHSGNMELGGPTGVVIPKPVGPAIDVAARARAAREKAQTAEHEQGHDKAAVAAVAAAAVAGAVLAVCVPCLVRRALAR